MTAPVVFISYSHDSIEHKRWVLELGTRLRNGGVDVILDQWDLGPGGDLPQFMESNLARAARVLMICTDRYVEKANAGTGGVGYEKMIVTADLMDTIGSDRLIPVVKSASRAVPAFLRTKLYVNLANSESFETEFDGLLRNLLNAPLFVKPPIGANPFQPYQGTAEPVQPTPVDQFMDAVSSLYERASSGLLRAEWVAGVMGCSKLLFDYARDEAENEGYIRPLPDPTLIQVTEEGRRFMVERSARK